MGVSARISPVFAQNVTKPFSGPHCHRCLQYLEAGPASDLRGLIKDDRQAVLSLGLRSQDRMGMPSMTTILTSFMYQAKNPTSQNLGADYG
jgi:hypothetical protein